uniref:Uncharacterized protein n=1 Tax=Arundo donax TaxID=35708 RepID=A0A0A8YJ35_ARUDO
MLENEIKGKKEYLCLTQKY